MRVGNRILRAPDDDPASPDNGGGGAGEPAPVITDPVKDTPAIAARPENLPEEFWDTEKGAVKTDAVAAKLQEFQAAQAGLVAKPEDIDWTLPADLDPDAKDTVFEINKDDPMVSALAPVLAGLPQAKITALVTAFAKYQVEDLKGVKAALQAEEQKLGEKYLDRINGAKAFIEKVVGKEKADRFRNTWVTAEQVEVIEALAKYAGGPQAASPIPGAENQETRGRTFFAGMAGSEVRQ